MSRNDRIGVTRVGVTRVGVTRVGVTRVGDRVTLVFSCGSNHVRGTRHDSFPPSTARVLDLSEPPPYGPRACIFRDRGP